jgi:hypothetical protein
LRGVATASTEQIRRLWAPPPETGQHATAMRSVCVVDRVDRGDIQAHASLGYSSTLVSCYAGTGAKLGRERGKARGKARLDLTHEFSPIVPMAALSWGTWGGYLVARLRRVFQMIPRGGHRTS